MHYLNLIQDNHNQCLHCLTNRYSFLAFSVVSRRVENNFAFSKAEANSKSLPGLDFFPLFDLKQKLYVAFVLEF